MDLEKLREMALDITKDSGNHEQTVQYLNDIVKYAEAQDLEKQSLSSANQKYTEQLEKARETNIKLFEQVTIQPKQEETTQETKQEYTEADILAALGEK